MLTCEAALITGANSVGPDSLTEDRVCLYTSWMPFTPATSGLLGVPFKAKQ